jgi:hypothetical protein
MLVLVKVNACSGGHFMVGQLHLSFKKTCQQTASD